MATEGTTTASEEALRARVAELEAALATRTSELASRTSELGRVTTERDSLRKAYTMVLEQLELIRHRLTVAKAERIRNLTQLELEFAAKKAELVALVKQLEEALPAEAKELAALAEGKYEPAAAKPVRGGGGRRNLDEVAFTEVKRIESPIRSAKRRWSASAGKRRARSATSLDTR